MTRKRLTPEQLSAVQSEKGKKARKASPWGRAPMCDSPGARLSYLTYNRKRSK